MAFTAGIVHEWLHMTEDSGSSAIVHLTGLTPYLNLAWHEIILGLRSANSREYVIFSVNRFWNHRHWPSLHAKYPPWRFIINHLTVTCFQILFQLHFMLGSSGLFKRFFWRKKFIYQLISSIIPLNRCLVSLLISLILIWVCYPFVHLLTHFQYADLSLARSKILLTDDSDSTSWTL